VAGVAGTDAGGRAGCAGTAGTARGCEPLGFTWVWPGLEVTGPFGDRGLGVAGAGGAGDAVGASPAIVDGPDGVLPPPAGGSGWPGTGWPGTGEPGTGETGGSGAAPPPPPPPPGVVTGIPPPSKPGPVETKIGVKPANGDGATVGLALPGLAGSTSAGTLRSWLPGRANSRIAEPSSTVSACIQSWADATAPAATAPT
jgi:hypothetical protein